ncbi:DUF899 domain-containing protein [Bowmanella dokdonensis]|uniref:DUF899 domain-containing protein n=1 Tax=Bowmanella dokdonensis TaxID=751969 RepID=A0A939INX3_9ALTE|nr:DUF899 domain-containing protein [Bowmanella dokdonensis]MBN7825300.1 DUF899 domain-containing protein [Bowmanella dokdonensis]
MSMEKRQVQGIERQISSLDDWRQAHSRQLAMEKAHTRAGDILAAERRRLPWLEVSPHYRFEGENGPMVLSDLFAGRRQLIVYHHMLRPGDPSPCSGCSMVGDQMPHLAHLHARDTSLVFVSRAPIDEIGAFRQKMGWQFPWFSTDDSFNADMDVTNGFGLNVFYRAGKQVYRTYYTSGRGVEMLGTPWALLDLTPLGRQEYWEASPPGTPQSAPYQWWRLHYEYAGTSQQQSREVVEEVRPARAWRTLFVM